MNRTCILVAGLDQESENKLQRAWCAGRLRVPLAFRRTGEGALTYLAAAQEATEMMLARPLLLVIHWPLVDMAACDAVRRIRSERRLRELIIVACHANWDLIEQRLAYSCGVDCCVNKTDDFSQLISQIRRVEDFWFKEPAHHH